MDSQPELFKTADDPGRKIFHGANGVELPYWERDGKIIRVALSDTLVLPVTNPKGGNIYMNVPRFGRVETKKKIGFLSQAAVIRRSIELNELAAADAAAASARLQEQRRLLLSVAASQAVPRSRSASTLAAGPPEAATGPLNFFNPRKLLRERGFSPVPKYLMRIEGITAAEALVYGAMTCKADDDDGVFKKSLLSVEKIIPVKYRGILKTVRSLLARRLIFKTTSFKTDPNHYRFLWQPEFDSEQRSLPSKELNEQSSGGVMNRVPHRSEQRSLHKNREELQRKHVHVSCVGEAMEGDLLGEIYELTEPEKRPENFQACWKRRIKEDALAVSQAIRETRSMKREGKIRKSIGGTLNWHYENRHKLGFPRKERQDKLRREMEEARRAVDEARISGSENQAA